VLHKMFLQSPTAFGETKQRAQWGTVYLASNQVSISTFRDLLPAAYYCMLRVDHWHYLSDRPSRRPSQAIRIVRHTIQHPRHGIQSHFETLAHTGHLSKPGLGYQPSSSGSFYAGAYTQPCCTIYHPEWAGGPELVLFVQICDRG
jgi:hypothetical protein